MASVASQLKISSLTSHIPQNFGNIETSKYQEASQEH